MEKPKRPLSAYNFFFRQERAKILGIKDGSLQQRDSRSRKAKRKHRKIPGMVGFKGLAVRCGKKWRELPVSAKARYENLFKQDQIRYRREMKQWHEYTKLYKNTDKTSFRIRIQFKSDRLEQTVVKSFANRMNSITKMQDDILPREALEPVCFDNMAPTLITLQDEIRILMNECDIIWDL